jgi:hypothetical protein
MALAPRASDPDREHVSMSGSHKNDQRVDQQPDNLVNTTYEGDRQWFQCYVVHVAGITDAA